MTKIAKGVNKTNEKRNKIQSVQKEAVCRVEGEGRGGERGEGR